MNLIKAACADFERLAEFYSDAIKNKKYGHLRKVGIWRASYR